MSFKLQNIAFICLLVPALLSAQAAAQNPHDALGRTVMADLVAAKNDDVRSHFSPALQANLSSAMMSSVWSTLAQKCGSYSSTDRVLSTVFQGAPTTIVGTSFTGCKVTLMISFDAIDEIQSIIIAPNSTLTPLQMESAARSVVDKLSGGDYAAVEARFNAAMQANLNKSQLQSVWQQTIQTFGAFSQTLVAQKVDMLDMVGVKCSFANKTAILNVSFDADNNVSGLWIVPLQ